MLILFLYVVLAFLIGIINAIENRNVLWFLYIYRYDMEEYLLESNEVVYFLKSIPLMILLLPYVIIGPLVYLIGKILIGTIFDIAVWIVAIKEIIKDLIKGE